MKIPNIIHQSWKDEHIPYDIYKKSWVDSWAIQHPNWERMFWTDEQNRQLVKTHYPEFYSFYQSLNPGIKKADFCRFLYMHKYGGVYVDLDFICLKNLTPLLKDYEIVLGRLSPDNYYYQIPNAFMASIPGLGFWYQTALDSMNAPVQEQSVESHAGPFRLQWAFEKYQPEKAIVYKHELIYPFDWIHFIDSHQNIFFRKDLKELAQSIKEKSATEISALFPEAYCLTFWTHNW
jgi:mannosyltransferase OCH1-like enzyme